MRLPVKQKAGNRFFFKQRKLLTEPARPEQANE
jgi:hypothetical protein